MAILFSCPYCTASVKVPDSASGKLGACPKCGTKIRIPTVTAPPTAPVMPVGPGPGELFAPGPVLPAAPAPIPSAAPPIHPSGPADPFDFSSVAATASHASQPTVTRRKSPVKKPPMGMGILIAVGLGLLALAGAGIWAYLNSLPVYDGSVVGTRAPAGKPIAVTIPWSATEVDAQTQSPVIEYFKQHKTSLTNNLLKIDIDATAAGLIVRFETTAESMLVSVDPDLVPDIKTLIAQNQAAWDEARRRELAQAAKSLCSDVAKAQVAGTRVESVSGYRDSVALNALVRGLGRHCVGVANKLNHPCVFEDEAGLLYFVVPIQTTEILVVEKSGEGRVRMLPEQFRIWASVPLTAAPVPRSEPAESPAPTATEKPVKKAGEEPPAADGDVKPAVEGDESMKPGMEKTMK